MRVPRWLRITLGILIVVLGGFAIVGQLAVVSVESYYSPEWTSSSSADARARGVFTASPVVATPVIRVGAFEVTVTDAWVEEVTRYEYKYFLVKRELREGRYRVVVILQPRAPLPVSAQLARLIPASFSGAADTVTFRRYIGGEGAQLTHLDLEGPLPDTIALTIIPDSSS